MDIDYRMLCIVLDEIRRSRAMEARAETRERMALGLALLCVIVSTVQVWLGMVVAGKVTQR